MIGRLRGKVVEHEDDTLVLDVNGVGYALRATSSVLQLVYQQLDAAKELEIVVHTEVRENDISLYGFSSSLEKKVFLLLQKVRGVGARVSLQIVSTIGAESLLSTIGQGSVAALCRVPGVGKKTAERIIVELREMVSELIGQASGGDTSLSSQVEVTRVAEDALLALEKLGFSSERARKAVVGATKELGQTATTEEILHVALTMAEK